MDTEMQLFITAAVRRSGALLLRHFRSATLQRDPKGAWDLVTEADRASEELLGALIRERFPDHDVFAEETGRSGTGSRSLWLIDPLDGTLNFARGLPLWGVSMALAEDGAVRYGAFYDPLLDELSYAERDRGATLNGQPLRTSGVVDLAAAVVYCPAVAHDPMEAASRHSVEQLWTRVMRLRMTGSVGNALAAIAAGRMDAAIGVRGGAWDFGAGGLLVREAGGHTTTFDGQPLTADGASVLAAATPQLHRALYELVVSSQ